MSECKHHWTSKYVCMHCHDEQLKEKDKIISEQRTHLAESICRECKCENNNTVNMDVVKRNLEYKKIILEQAEKIKQLEVRVE